MKIALAPITSAQLTAIARKCALRNGTYVEGIALLAVDEEFRSSGTGMRLSVSAEPPNLREVVQLYDKSQVNRIKIGNFIERLPLAPLGALRVTRVQKGQVVRLAGDRHGHAGIHPSA